MDREKYTMLMKKKAGEAILVSVRADCKVRKAIGDKEGHYKMIKGPIL